MKHIYLCVILSISLSILNSCSKDDVYSCDSKIDKQVKKEIVSIKQMTRSSWLNLKPEFKIPIYRAFSIKQKLAFWTNKYDQLAKLDWDEKELRHIRELYSLISTPDFFKSYKNKTQTEIDESELFFYNWSEYAKNTLNWNMKTIYSIVATGDEVLDKIGTLKTIDVHDRINIHMGTTKSTKETGGGNDCWCSQLNDWCDPTSEFRMYCSDKTGCDKTVDGCGWFFRFPCTGGCRGLGTGD